MPVEVILPKVDMDMTVGRISGWHVDEGAEVTAGQPLFDIETDKAAMEVEAPASGRVAHRLMEDGDIPVGAPVAWIYAAGEEIGARPAGGPVAEAEVPEAVSELADPDVAVPDLATDRVRATPAARSAARAAGLKLSELVGTGPRGRIGRADVAALQAAPAAGPVRLHRAEEGPEDGLLLIHGFAADRFTWMALEPFLPERRGVTVAELPGHGSTPAVAVDGFAALARLVVEAVDAASLSRVHVVGHSLGGALALALADVRPRTVASLTLIAPAGLGPEVDGQILSGLVRASRAESLAPWFARLGGRADWADAGLVRAAMAARQDPALRDAQAVLAEALFPDGTVGFDLTAALDRMTCPTRLIWGKRDAVLPWRQALVAPGRVGLHLFAEAGHVPHLEAPEAVAAVIAGVLAEAER